jgi:hypothetical protein
MAAQQVAAVQIVRFQAVPTNIRAGEQSMLDWQVLNADSVSISGIGTVAANGQRAVTPTQSTTYTLTARNARGEVTAIARVIVEAQPAAQFLSCTASPATINSGEASNLIWSTANADTVSISNGIGNVATSGSQTVTPTASTTYTLTATNASGPVTCTATVTVNSGPTPVQPPRIIGFTANPTTITAGQSSTLSWNVENATTVDISGLGEVPAQGTRAVSPNTSVTYVITARNDGGVVQANAPITVNPATGPGPGPTPTPAPVIGGCQATPTTSTTAGGDVVINYFTTNATTVTFSPAVAGAGLNGPVTVRPTATTTYTLTATGTENRTATCTVVANVTPAPEPPTAIITGPSTITTIQRQTTLDASQSTNPAGGALTYIWTPVGTGATVLDQGQPVTRVQFSGQFGDYVFNLTVRNALGQQATTSVTVRFISTTVP